MKQLIILNLILILLSSCSGKAKKEALNPKAVALNNRAIVLVQKLNYDSALILLDKAIAIDKNYNMPHANKVGIYICKKEFDKALAEIEIVIKKEPDSAENWSFAGMLHDGLGDTLTAKKYYKKSIEIGDKKLLNPAEKGHIISNRMNRAISLILLGKGKEGKDELKKLKEENPQNNVFDMFLNRNRQDLINDLFKKEDRH
jgi:tetratricopeptide (TPR) repeat protein